MKDILIVLETHDGKDLYNKNTRENGE